MTSPFFSVVILLSVVALSAQQSPEGTSENITCYDWDGNGYGNNTQCPGSHICCNTANLCNENRFCIENNQTIVPTCAVYPWNDCSNICQYGTFNVFQKPPQIVVSQGARVTYNLTVVTGTGYLPRVIQCSDGSWCCDNEPACCADHEGIVLNGLGAIVSTDSGNPSTSSSVSSTSSLSTTSTSSTARTTSSMGTTASSSPSATAISGSASTLSTKGGLTTGADAGLGVGVAVVAIVLAAVAYLLWKRSSKRSRQWTMDRQEPNTYRGYGSPSRSTPQSQPYKTAVEKPANEHASYEMPGYAEPTYHEMPTYATPR
jgi:hypothetical protein